MADMKLFVLHISDIHLRDASSVAIDRLRNVAPAVQNLSDGITEVAVVISGDVAWSGTAAQYALSKAAFVDLRRDLLTRFKGTTVQFFFVPGNHDCDFSGDHDARSRVVNDMRTSQTTKNVQPSTVKLCCEVQHNFDEFSKELVGITPVTDADRMYLEYVLPVGDRRVLVQCYNTAWMSTNPEKQASLVFPDRYTTFQSKESFDFCVSIFHHPYNWLRTDNGLSFRKQIEATADLVLTGHEHDGSQYEKRSFGGTVTSYFEGAVFQDYQDVNRSGFMSMVIDLVGQKQRVYRYEWDGNLYLEAEATSGWVPWSRGAKTANRDFVVAADFLQQLNDLGVVLSHPTRDRLTLDDVYILPDFREMRISPKLKSSNKFISGDEFLLQVLNLKRVVVFGSQQSGKTSLAKKLFVHFFGLNVTPVLLRGADIKGFKIEQAEKLLERAFSEQYANPQLPTFNQLDRDKVLIIIDDFEKALNSRSRAKFLDALSGRYERICIIADDLLKLEELVTGEMGLQIDSNFAQFQMQEFGHLLRNKLIHRWYEIDSDYVNDLGELERRVHRAEILINELLGRSYLPSFPIFILSFLQAHELGNPIATDAGTYGSLYEVLITGNLASIKSKKYNLDTRRTYLSEMAYWLFCAGKTEISDTDWSLFHSEYCAKYTSQASKTELREDFFQARMFINLDGLYRFRHPYYYYYFVARYFHNNLHAGAVRAQVLTLCDQLDKEEQANICLFLTHLSKDPFILDAVLSRASKIFSEHKPAELRGDDIAFLKNLTNQLPSVMLSDEDFTARKDRRLRQLDAAREEQTDSTALSQEVADMVNRFKLAVRTLEVLGQIVKNFHGSLVGPDKQRVVQECYFLGLRTVEMLFTTVRAHTTEFVEWFYERVREAHPDLVINADIEAKVKQSIFHLVELGCFGMLKRISHAVGHTQLEMTYAEILKANPTPAIRLIDVSVKLDTVVISEVDLAAVKKNLDNCVLCEDLLNRLAVYYFYIFPSTERVRQRVCSELGIQRVTDIDIISNAQKKLPPADRS
jgi:predicted MPP superfamily phosphohydrolase